MENILNPQEFIVRQNEGSAIAALVSRPDAHLDYLIRENSKTIRSTSQSPNIVLPCMIREDNVLLIMVLIRTTTLMGTTNTYEVWIDYHGAEGPRLFEAGAARENYGIHFYGDDLDDERTIFLRNHLADFYAAAAKAARELPPWTKEMFEQARQSFCSRNKTIQERWTFAETQGR